MTIAGDGDTTIARVVDDDDAVETSTGIRLDGHFRYNRDDGEEEEYEYDGYEENLRTLSRITTRVADWTLRGTATATAATHRCPGQKEQRHFRNSNDDVDDDDGANLQDADDDESSSEDDYHGEIESVATTEFNNNNNKKGDAQEEEDTFIHIITNEHQISLHPPPTTSPLVLVDLAALTGCMPTSAASKSILVGQLMESLLGSSSSSSASESANDDKLQNNNNRNSNNNNNDNNSNDDNNQNMGDGLSLHFNERVNELFESGVAYHIDSSYDIVKYCNSTMVNDCDDGNDDDGEPHMHQHHPYVIIPYPEFLATDKGSSSPRATKQLRSTLRLWKLIHTLPTTTSVSITTSTATNSTTPTTPVAKSQQQQQQLQMNIIQLMKRMFNHLCNTSRSLLWKADMYIELCYIFNDEYTILLNMARRNEYKQWSDIERRLRLDKLYDIRETFVCQVESVKLRYDVLYKERESRVRAELARRRRLRGETMTIMTTSNICDFVVDDDYVSDDVNDDDDDDDGWGGETIHEDDIIGGGDDTTYYGKFVVNGDNDIINDDEDCNDDDDDDEEWSPLEMTMKKKLNPSGMHIVINGADTSTNNDVAMKTNDDTATTTIICQKNKLEPISHDENRQRISNRLLLQQQNKWRQKQQEEDETTTSPRHVSSSTVYDKQHHLVRSTWKEEEEIVRELLKTTDERIAEATLLKLQERLQNVDDLLETLQEEEWANDDDDVEDDDKDEREDEGNDDEIDSQSSSLLDQILAMILGGLSKEIIHIRSLSSLQVKAAADVWTNMTTDEAHFRYIKDEHESIVKEWIKVFGRLPKLCQHSLEEETAATLISETIDNKKKLNGMHQFGIAGGTVPKVLCSIVKSDDRIDSKNFTPIDNEYSTWDEVEDWDALFL